MLQRCGVVRLIVSKVSIESSMPASCAIAGIWSVVFVEPPRAMSMRMAFSKAFLVMILRGVRSSFTRPTIRLPLSKAILRFSPDTARAVAHPGRLMPSDSVTQAMVFAVIHALA